MQQEPAVIAAVEVTLFETTTRLARDSDGHAHPGPERPATEALLVLRDRDGVEGHALGSRALLGKQLLEGHLRPVLVGRSAFEREALRQNLAKRQRGNPTILHDRTLALVELALWDLIGRRLDMPVWRLLGGVRDRVPAYASTMCGDDVPGGLGSPEDYARFARFLVEEQHYRAIKLHTWMPPIPGAPDIARDIAACAAVREAVGPDIPLMLDSYHWYSRTEALRLGRAIQELGYAWFEEPMDEHSIQAYRWLAAELEIPVLGPESAEGKHQTRAEWLVAGACDILRTGVHDVGGIGPAMKCAHLAEAFDMECEVHGGGPGNLALLGGIASGRYYERGLLHPHYDFERPPPHLSARVDPLDADGFVRMPGAPGLGEAIDLDYVRRHEAGRY